VIYVYFFSIGIDMLVLSLGVGINCVDSGEVSLTTKSVCFFAFCIYRIWF